VERKHSFTVVVPTRDGAPACRQLLDFLKKENESVGLDLRVVFLGNDTQASAREAVRAMVTEEKYASLRPVFLQADQEYSTVEENIRYTLGKNLTAVDEHFLIIGNTDQVNMATLRDALQYIEEHRIDLLLVGVINREVYNGKTLRQFYATPRHFNAKNLVDAKRCHGADIFAKSMTDYGPVDYNCFIGAQIYTKQFFVESCAVQETMPEQIYSIPLSTLEVTMRKEWNVGFFPEVVSIRIDELEHPVSAGRQRTNRGLSNHILFSAVSNTLNLSMAAFATVVNSQAVSIRRGAPQYLYSNFLHNFVEQISSYIRLSPQDAALRYSATEIADIVRFGKRLQQVDIGLPADQKSAICTWLQQFGVLGDLSDQKKIDALLAGSAPVLQLLALRPDMERWVAQLT
jgi:hypothetical protein